MNKGDILRGEVNWYGDTVEWDWEIVENDTE